MRHNAKGEEPLNFLEWKSQANRDWQPTFSNFQNPQKRTVHTALIEEQGHVCCYCGREITLVDSHLEHFRPQETYEPLALWYQNLFASCIRELGNEIPRHCGHAKGNWFSERLAISPLSAFGWLRFKYNLEGEISPVVEDPVDESASETIERLEINHSSLNRRRKETLEGIFSDDFLSTVTYEELQTIAERFSTRRHGRYEPFGHVVARYAMQLMESMV